MIKKLIFTILLLINASFLFSNDVAYIRAYDLGGGGLKTALFCYDKTRQVMDWVEPMTQLGACPDDMEVHMWIRQRMHEILGKDLDAEIESGYFFGFSLAGLNKLRAKAFPNVEISTLFELPSHKVRCIDDGAAHLVASLKALNLELPEGPIWNFSIGTHVGWGFTNRDHHVRNFSDFWLFFDKAPWLIKEPLTGIEVFIPCGSKDGFEQLVVENHGIVSKAVFIEFASRWKAYIESCILEYSTITAPHKGWGTPAAVVFTGGYTDIYGDSFVKTLLQLNLNIPLFIGPKNAGLLGAAWNTITNPFGKTALIEAIISQSIPEVQQFIDQGADLNKKDALGNSPLSEAIRSGNLKLVELLLRHGAGVNIRDFTGQTPLFLAVKLDNFDMTTLLLDYDGEVNICDYWNQAPLLFTTQNRALEHLLLTHDAQLQ